MKCVSVTFLHHVEATQPTISECLHWLQKKTNVYHRCQMPTIQLADMGGFWGEVLNGVFTKRKKNFLQVVQGKKITHRCNTFFDVEQRRPLLPSVEFVTTLQNLTTLPLLQWIVRKDWEMMKSEFFCTTLNNDYQHSDSLANSHMPCIRYEFGTKVAEKPEPLLSLFIAHSLCIL